MKATLFRAIPMALAVLVVAAGAATAALVVSGEAPEFDAAVPNEVVPADDPVTARPPEEDHDRSYDGTPRTDQGLRSRASDDDAMRSTIEDRPLRHEARRDEDRLETRRESLHVGTQRYVVARGGSVTVRREGGTLTIVDVDAAPGWVPSIERSNGYEVEVTLRRAGERIDFSAEIEHDRVKTRVRER